MIIKTGSVDNILGTHLQKVYKPNAAGAVEKTSRGDMATISKLAALIEKGRASAIAVPDIRNEAVEKARQIIQNNDLPETSNIAAAIINRAVKGLV